MNSFPSSFDNNIPIDPNLSQILSHWSGNGFVVVASSRGDRTPEQNELLGDELKKDLKYHQLGYVPVEAVGQKQGPEGGTVPISEKALLVPNNGEDGFLETILRLAKKFDQWGICYASGDGSGSLINSDGTADAEFSSFKIGIGTFFTRMCQSRENGVGTFRLERLKKAERASGVLELQSRSLRGELFALL